MSPSMHQKSLSKLKYNTSVYCTLVVARQKYVITGRTRTCVLIVGCDGDVEDQRAEISTHIVQSLDVANIIVLCAYV